MTQTQLLNLDIIPYASRIIIGVSGGIDSISLLHLLNEAKHEMALEILVAHYDHALRPRSNRDSIFVSTTAASLNLKFINERNRLKCPKNTSIEDFARRQRLDFFVRTARKFKADAVVLAHTQDDLAETVLMRLLRGSGLSGLRSILPRRELHGITFLRPLLNTKRIDLEAYLKRIKAKHIEDPTNHEDIYLRNKIRHSLIPYIEKNFSTAVKEKLAELAMSAAFDYEVLQIELDKAWGIAAQELKEKIHIKLNTFKTLPVPIRRMLLREAAARLLGKPGGISFTHITLIETLVKKQVTDKMVSCSAGLTFTISNKFLTLSYNKK